MSISQELAPALTCAHLHFGDKLPQDLILKLRNQTQALNTLFELGCLGFFLLCHLAAYEPTLASGKVPDLKISLAKIGDISVECKSQNLLGSEYQRILRKFTSLSFEAIENTSVQRLAWGQDLRIEIHLNATPSPDDLAFLRKFIADITVDDLLRGISIGPSIHMLAVPKHQPYLIGPSAKISHIAVGTMSTKISHENAHIGSYSWPGIDRKRRWSLRNLMAEAGRKLSANPVSPDDMICLQTDNTRQFAPDVNASLMRQEFVRVPIVWINPLNESELICRTDALQIREAIFKPFAE